MRSILSLLTLCLLFCYTTAQVGNLDPAFGGTGIVKSGVEGTSYKSIVVQTDGKVVVGGSNVLARYNTNGTLDASFGTGGKKTTPYPVGAIAMQSDGKIVVGAGQTESFNLLRYTTTGKLDSTFGVDGIRNTDFDYDAYNFDGFYPTVMSIAVQSDGKIIALGSGDFWEEDPFGSDRFVVGRSFALARYTSDGILDRTFNGDGRYNGTDDHGSYDVYLDIAAIVLQPDRKIVIAGSKDGNFFISRYRTDGRPDSSFGVNGVQTTDFGFEDLAHAVAIQGDDKIVVSGTSNDNFAIARYLSNGSLDLSFDGDGKQTTDISSFSIDAIFSLKVQADGKIVAGGTSDSRFALARYSTSGALDATFSGDGKQTTDAGAGEDGISDIAISGNRLYVGGYTGSQGVVGAYNLGTLPSTVNTKAIKVNIYGGSNPYTNSEWNNWNVSSSLSSTAFKFANATASTVSAVLSQSSSITDNGTSYGGYMAPPPVLRYASASTTTTPRTLTLKGLITTKKYSLELYSGRGLNGYSTRFTVNGNTVTIVTSNNKTDKASFINLVPTASGEIVVNISGVNSNNYLNGFVLTEQGTCTGIEITPLSPLKGQFCNGTSLTLTASGGTSYKWYNAGTLIPNQTATTYAATQAGIYTVRAYNGACASGLSEDAALEPTLAYPNTPPGPIGTPDDGMACSPVNVGIITTVGQKYTWLQNGTAVKGPVDGTGDPISFSFGGTAASARIAPSDLTASGAITLTESEYSIQPTYYNVIATKPGCSDTVSGQTFEVYHAAPVQGLAITSLAGTSVAFKWQPLAALIDVYRYSVTTNPTPLSELSTAATNATVASLTPGTTYYIHIVAVDVDDNGNESFDCATEPTTLQFTTPSTIPTITTFSPTSGPAGVGVMIKGTNLIDVTAVRFNGIAATTIYKASPTLLYVTVPSGATTGKIQVQAQGGSVTSSGTFTVSAISSKWVTKAGLATPRVQHGTIATNGKIYVFGGRSSSTSVLNVMAIYNPSTNTYVSGAAMPVATRGMAVALGSNGSIYMFGGANSSATVSSTYRYTPSTNSWAAMAGMPAAVFEAAAAATSNGKIYVFGGEPSTAKTTSTNATRIYTISTNSWSSGANMPVGVQQHSAITGTDGRIYVIGGRAFSANEPLGLVQIYNPSTNTWSSGAAMPIPKVQFGATIAADGRIYVIGGKAAEPNSTGPYFHTVEIYNPTTNSWSTGPVIPVALGQQTAVNSNDNLYAISGSDNTIRNYNFQLTLAPVAPSGLTATAVSSSQINLKWTDKAKNETGYTVQRATASTGPFSTIASLGANVTAYSNTGRTAGTTYYYRVKATNSAGSSPYSNVANAKTVATSAMAVVSDNEIIDENEKNTHLNLYVQPNPARISTRVSFSVDEDQQVRLQIYDVNGRLVEKLYDGFAEKNKLYQFQWQVGSQIPGIYFSRLTTGKKALFKKIILQR